MELVVTSAQMRLCDNYAIQTLRISGLILMENAGRGCVDSIEKIYGNLCGKKFIIVCGKGNNGGDGFVVARHLFVRGAFVTTLLLGKKNQLTGDAKINYDSLESLIKQYKNTGRISVIQQPSTKKINLLPKSDFIVDAIFGTGFIGQVKQPFLNVIKWMNKRSEIKVSIDIPSGLNSDTGTVENVAVKSSLTASMGFKKIGLTIGNGIEYAGRVEVVDISVPKEILNKYKIKSSVVNLLDVKNALPKRMRDAHKHSVGKIFIIAGSAGMTGAAALTAQSAMRAGAGAVILGTPKSVYPILAKKITEVMVIPLNDNSDGALGLNAYESICKNIDWADLVIIGPGISRNHETAKLIQRVILHCKKPMLIDADGLNNIADDISILKKTPSKEIIITPHMGEFSRLTNLKVEEIEENKIEIARNFALKNKLTLVLKGAPTITVLKSSEIFINSTGNPGMASAGMGDVLSGLIAGLWGQGMSACEAAYSGVFIHGFAGDLAKLKYGEKSIMALDVQSFIPQSILQIESSNCK
ncbi:MAG: NAD(P)H-hydrate dehydratase [Ignavibacteriales bacterium]|nr:NAD(P)H-hydrate dehydratase [Ignavibacteriales bacterium]